MSSEGYFEYVCSRYGKIQSFIIEYVWRGVILRARLLKSPNVRERSIAVYYKLMHCLERQYYEGSSCHQPSAWWPEWQARIWVSMKSGRPFELILMWLSSPSIHRQFERDYYACDFSLDFE